MNTQQDHNLREILHIMAENVNNEPGLEHAPGFILFKLASLHHMSVDAF